MCQQEKELTVEKKNLREVFSGNEGVRNEKVLKWVSYAWSVFSKIGLQLVG